LSSLKGDFSNTVKKKTAVGISRHNETRKPNEDQPTHYSMFDLEREFSPFLSEILLT